MNFKKIGLLSFGLLLSSQVFSADANNDFTLADKKTTAEIITKFNKIDPIGVKEVYKTNIANGNLYFLRLNNNAPVFVDLSLSTIITGQAFDTKTKTSISDKYYSEWTKINFNELPLDKAIKNDRGADEKHKVVVFADPNCGYCKKLEQNLINEKSVSVYTLLVPILGEDSRKKSVTFQCIKDKKEQLTKWQDWMVHGKFTPLSNEEFAKCEQENNKIVIANRDLMEEKGGKGTPFGVSSKGKKLPGLFTVEDLK